MGISSALYSGVSGLNTNGQAMSVIGNNLANTNTLGFKGSRTIFSDLLSASINGSGGQSQVGRGVGMSRVDQIFSQGTFESTESNLDVAIEGDGFFILKNQVMKQPTTQGPVLSGLIRTDIWLTRKGSGYKVKLLISMARWQQATPRILRLKAVAWYREMLHPPLQLTTNLDSTEPIISCAI